MARPTIMASSHATTQGISITVDARFSPEHSAPSRRHWFFLYTITITNESDLTVQLVSRHWIITDEDGRVEDVRGPGVVGEQPVLAPGERFEYTSGTPLPTPSGIMVGSYEMERQDGSRFDVAIPAFSLDSPYQAKRLN
jgi:ApaG protein